MRMLMGAIIRNAIGEGMLSQNVGAPALDDCHVFGTNGW